MNRNYNIIAHQCSSYDHPSKFETAYCLGFDKKLHKPVILHITGDIDKTKPRRTVTFDHNVIIGDIVFDDFKRSYAVAKAIPSLTAEKKIELCNRFQVVPDKLAATLINTTNNISDITTDTKYTYIQLTDTVAIAYAEDENNTPVDLTDMIPAPDISDDILTEICLIDYSKNTNYKKTDIDNIYADLIMDLRMSHSTLCLCNHTSADMLNILHRAYFDMMFIASETKPIEVSLTCRSDDHISIEMKYKLLDIALIYTDDTLNTTLMYPDDIKSLNTLLTFLFDVTRLLGLNINVNFKCSHDVKQTYLSLTQK